MRLVERIAVLEAALDRCRTLADKAGSESAEDYCRQIGQIAAAALDRAAV